MVLRLSRDDILNGDIIKTMFMLGWPMMLSSLFQTLYNLADMFWLGRLPGNEAKIAVAAINLTWPIVFFFISFAGGLGRGGIPIISQYIGAGRRDKANHYTGQIFSVVIIIASVMAILGFFLSKPIFSVMGAEGELLDTASLYGAVIFLGLPFMFIVMGGGQVISAEGDTVTPLIISGTSVLINAVLDPILIFGLLGLPAMGVIGAAVATVIARIIAAVWLLHMLLGGKLRLRPSHRDFRPRWKSVKFILKVGLPSSASMSAMAFGFVVMESILLHLPDQTLAIASYGIGNRIVNIMFVFVNGLSSSLGIMLGQALGANKIDRVSEIGWKGLNLMFYMLLFSAAIIYVFRDPIVRFFIPTNSDVIDGAKTFLSIVLIGIPYFGIFRVESSLLVGSGHTMQSMVVSVVRLWGIRLPLAYYLAFVVGWHSTGVWFAMAISNMISAGIGSVFYLKGDWKKRIIKAKPKTPARISSQ